MSGSQTTTFGDPSGFLAWFDQGGKLVEFPLGPKGWKIQIGPRAEDTRIISSFYTVESRPPYGAWKICGVLVDFGGHQASGVIELGFDGEKPAITNRRRLTKEDRLSNNKKIVEVIESHPDRVEEPVAIVIRKDDIERFQKLKNNDWLALLDSTRDAIEAEVVKSLRRHLASL